nr:hypothetical protein A6C57_22660 [Fibrella sp. ES10-3-2-2]
MKKNIFKENLSFYVEKTAQLLFIILLLTRAINREAVNSQKFELLFYLALSIVIITSFRNAIRRAMQDPTQLKLLMYMSVLFPIIALIIFYLFKSFQIP